MTRLHLSSRTCLPFLLAVAGFSYALATPIPHAPASGESDPSSAAVRAAAQARTVGAPLRFTNPFLLAGTDPAFPLGGNTKADPQGFDLGDAVQGQSIRRVITAAGGYQPYTFAIQPNFDKPTFGTAVLPNLSSIGFVSGNVSALASTFLRFNVLLTDFIATQRTGVFYLKLINGPPPFRFAQDRLATAQQGNHYYTDLETIGGVPPITYRIVPGSVTTASTKPGLPAAARLEDAGLALSSDGILIGRPIVNGTLNFSVTATDAMGATASPRSGAGGFQAFALTVEANSTANSELTTLQCSIKGSVLISGKDNFTYGGIIDTRNENAASLAGSALTLRIGQTAVSGTFDARGRVNAVLPGNEKFTAGIQGTRIKIRLTNANLADGVGVKALKSSTANLNTVIGLELISFRTSDFLNFATVSRGGKFAMRYQLGARGIPMTGAFQVITVRGFDGKTGGPVHLSLTTGRAAPVAPKVPTPPKVPKPPKTPKPAPAPGTIDGDSWDVFFIAVPRFGIEGGKTLKNVIAANTTGTIRIGQNFSQTLTFTKKPVQLEFKATGKSPGLFRLLLNPKTFIHHMQTNVIPELETAISPAIDTKTLTVFPLGLDLTGYSGESGRAIAPNFGTWTQR